MSEVFLKFYSSSENRFNTEEIYRYLSVKEPTEQLIKLTDSCINECNDALGFRVCYTVSDVTVCGQTLCFDAFGTKSSDLSKNLKGCEKVIIFSATIGLGIDRLISKYSVISPAKAVVFQAIGAERIECLCDIFNEEMRAQYEKKGYSLRPRFSPGYGDLSLEIQKDIFSLLDCRKRIGLTLNDSLLMSPSKSVTAFIGMRTNG